MKALLVGLAAALLAVPAGAQEENPPPLPALNIDAEGVSVMGVSSGGYMATQLAVAWPARFPGLAVFAAGPWGCAQGDLSRALNQCMNTRLGLPDREALNQRHARYLADERVGAPQTLARQRVYVWHGQRDTTVDSRLGDLLAEQYRHWLAKPEAQLKVERTPAAGHGWPVSSREESSVDCDQGGSPYLLDCGLDGAGQALQWLYGEDMQAPSGSHQGTLLTFDQSAFYDGRRLADEGYLFVPESCAEGASCALSVALHGCGMSAEQIGETFVRHSGLNAWAAENRLVMLYPQAAPSLPNPKACWDWWGYDESSWQRDPLHDSRQGRQVQAIKAMVDQLVKPAT